MKNSSLLVPAGVLLRDWIGNWIMGFVLNIGMKNSIFVELWGVRESLLIARSLNIQSLVVELDVVVVVQFLTKKVASTHPCYILVEDCLQIMQMGGFVKFDKFYEKRINVLMDWLIWHRFLLQFCIFWMNL
ncbi:hypothetical protein REPUB_Repub13aG0019100 [Reevesia pubescens]